MMRERERERERKGTMTGDCELPGPASHPDLSAPSLLAEEL